MIRIANRDARWYVTENKEFKGSNTFAEWINDKYVVFSYGKHWILYLFDSNFRVWYGCNEKTSTSTSKQSSQLHPNVDIDIWLSQYELQKLI